jgi:hypothetical protein
MLRLTLCKMTYLELRLQNKSFANEFIRNIHFGPVMTPIALVFFRRECVF